MKCNYCGIETSNTYHMCKQMKKSLPKEICKYCKQEIYIRNIMSRPSHLSACKGWKLWNQKISDQLTKEFLIEEHHNNQKGLALIARELEISSDTVKINV